ncbi:MAG: hypothetical protein WCI43_04465 [Candidatus Firestonebacteria bacterium]
MLKIRTFRIPITPPVGTRLAGYGAFNYSKGIYDELFLSGIAFLYGKKKAVLLSFDLLGMDESLISSIRKACAVELSIKETDVILTCTHTHSGPHTRSTSKEAMRDLAYSKELVSLAVKAVSGGFLKMVPVEVYCNSTDVPLNINRRVILQGKRFLFLPHHKDKRPLAKGTVDNELGAVYFVKKGGLQPEAVIVNYSAHPLVSQKRGGRSYLITSDYPGSLRRNLEKNLGGFCLFSTGACGDLHPKYYEGGFTRMEEMGRLLAKEVSAGFKTALKTPGCKVSDPVVETKSINVTLKIGKKPGHSLMPLFAGKKAEKVRVQFLRLGDVCFTGVPGELLAEPGLEIKWNSPFKWTFILYNSTGYLSYLPHANAYTVGGYEVETSQVKMFEAFKMVSAVIMEFEKWRS